MKTRRLTNRVKFSGIHQNRRNEHKSSTYPKPVRGNRDMFFVATLGIGVILNLF